MNNMQYTETQLEVIRIFGRKDLSFGCLVYIKKIDNYFHIAGKVNGEPYLMVYRHGEQQIIFLKDNEGDYEILGHIPHFERILEVLFENDIGVNLWNIHKRSIMLDFLNEKDYLCKTRQIDYDWTKEPLEQPETTLKELLSLFSN